MVIRIKDLPLNGAPNANQFVATDLASTEKLTIQDLVDTGAPIASQATAEAGTDNNDRMTALATAQAIAFQAATAAQGDLADTAVQPGDLAAVATSGNYNDLSDQPSLSADLIYPVKADAEAATIPLLETALRINGDVTVGDGLGGLYIDTDNGSTDTFVSSGGTSRTWYRAPDVGAGRLVGVFSSRAAALLANVPLPTQRVSVLAHTGFIVDYVRDAAGTALTTADGAKWSPDGEAYPQHWGWEPTLSTADQTTILAAMLTWGGECALPYGYTFETDYILVTVTRDTRLRVDGVHKASAEPTTLLLPMMRLNCTPTDPWHITVEGTGTIDCAAKVVDPGEASGSAYLFYYSDFLTVRGPLTFFAGNTLAEATADTAIVPSYCQRTLIDGCRFFGFADHSIYTTGGPTGSETQRSYDLTVTNCLFVGNAAGAVRVAREHKRVSVTNNICRDGGRLFISAGGATNLKSASMIDVSHNIIYNTYATAIDIRYPDANSAVTVIGNHVYDWGGTELAPAIRLLGVSNFDVSHNVCVPVLATQGVGTTSCGTGIYIEEHAGDDSAAYACRNGKVTDNTAQVFTRSGFSNAPFVARFITQVGVGTGLNEIVVHDNTLLYPVGLIDMIVTFDGADALRGAKYIRRNKDGNIGYRGADPLSPVEILGAVRVSRTSDATRYLYLDVDDTTVARIESRSPSNSARIFSINATTDASNTAPTGGSVELQLRVLGTTRLTIDQNGYVKPNAPTYADQAAALAAGVPVGALFKTAAGAVLIKT